MTTLSPLEVKALEFLVAVVLLTIVAGLIYGGRP